jgi:predicted dehydrogenase
MQEILNIGIIGCGNISGAYLNAAKRFPSIKIIACADINAEAAKATAATNGIVELTVDELLSNSDVEIILNLTTPQAHTEINLKALNAGKHVYCEKPLALERDEGQQVLKLAEDRGLLVGCAPDTFLGGGIQTCRKIIDDGKIGRPVAGTAFMMCHGHEGWHPNPGFYYLKGGGPMFDMGPYYLTALVNLLGPVRRVAAFAQKTFDERIATSNERNGERLHVEIPTHVAGTMEFQNGAIITMVTSFDVWNHTNHFIEIHGENGSLQVPDPNTFNGPVHLFKPGFDGWQNVPLTHGYKENYRSIGVADMVRAIHTRRINRCSGELAYHVLDVMHAFHDSATAGHHIEIESTCQRPLPLPVGLVEGELD